MGIESKNNIPITIKENCDISMKKYHIFISETMLYGLFKNALTATTDMMKNTE